MLRDTLVRTNLVQNNAGILLFFDTTRNEYVSISRENVAFGINHNNISSDRYLYVAGKVQTQTTGSRVPRNAYVTSITVQTSNTVTASFNLRKNNTSTNIHTLSISAEQGKTVDNLMISVDEDDWLQVFLSNVTGTVDFPVYTLELAWR